MNTFYQKLNNKMTQTMKNYRKKKRKIDELFRESERIRALMRYALDQTRFNKGTRGSRLDNILGCNLSEFKNYIESLFEPWMTWENRGKYDPKNDNIGWDLDHIIPLKEAKTLDQLYNLNRYTNLRPLCSFKNRSIKR